MFSVRRQVWRTGIAAVLVSVPLSFLPSGAIAADTDLASGQDWNVTQAPGGYLVTVDLADKLPMKSDAPTIEVDGVSIGLATESLDGKSLSVFTTDPSVATADDAEQGWFSKPSDAPAQRSSSARLADVAAAAAAPLDENPASIGSYEFTESIYNFGTQAIPLAAIGGVRGELEGKIYLPKTGGARPTVLLLHGRHTSCARITGTSAQFPANPAGWPCAPGFHNIPSFAGYDGTARALASNGYSVVSVAANAINSNDGVYGLDQGAQARGQLLLDTLTMLDKANKGEPVSYFDAATNKDVSLLEALANQAALPGLPETAATSPMTAADLVGRFDLTNIGMMGHSRGGEGVTSAATLNQGLEKPWGIKSILPLAPVDFARMTVPDVPMNVILPYCDGDVSNQQGQHMLDDSRYAFDDDVLRSGVWAMGANHNFFNSVWNPATYGFSASDDWGATSTDAVCGPRATTNIRMTGQEQYDMGTAYMAGWFRLTLGGEKQFLPMFDGTGAVPAVLNGEDVRSMSTAPSSARKTISTFESTSSLVRTAGASSATVCASAPNRTVTQQLPACTTTIGTSATPHWTPATNGGNVPATPVTKLAWTALSTTAGTTVTPSELRVSVPAAKRDASTSTRLSVKMAADESVATGTDMTLKVIDANGVTYSSLVSALNPLALQRFPGSTSTLLKKIVLQQVNVPTADLTAAGLNVSDIREVRFAAATGADGTATGAAYLSDLAFEVSSVGTPVVKPEPVINIAAPTISEGNGPGTADLAVYLNGAATTPVSGYVSVLGSATGRGGITMEKVTFAPGEVCKVVSAPILGDTATSTTTSTAIKSSVINTSGAVMGKKALGNLVVREDDGITPTAPTQTNPNPAVVPMLPSAGVPGDACAEVAHSATTGTVTASDQTPAPGDSVTFTATGYRVNEGVTFSLGTKVLAVATADGSGTATFTGAIPDDATIGENAVTAVGSGTGFTSVSTVSVLQSTGTTLSISPEIPGINEEVTLTASVEGVDAMGSVEFFDGSTSLGTAATVEGVATLVLPGFKAGDHELTATFGQTPTAQASTSNPVSLVLEKGKSGIVLDLAAGSSVYGAGATGTVTVADGDGGTVTVRYAGRSVNLALGSSDSATFALPAGLSAGGYTVSAVFNGTDRFEPSGVATAGYRVTKAPTSASVSAKSSVKRGKTLTVKTTVRGAKAGTYPTGTVKVYVKTSNGSYALKKTVTLYAGNKGVVSTGVKVTKKKATIRVKTVYSGSGNYGGSSTTSKAVSVR